jgi:hypothetical protein
MRLQNHGFFRCITVDDYLVAHSVDELLNLPVLRVPPYSPNISKRGSGGKYSTSANIERFLRHNLPSKTDPEFLASLEEKFHSPFDRQRLKGTTVVRWRGEVRVKVNGQAKPWPAAVVYYHWLRWRQDPKGQAQIVPIRRTWLPVWQGLLEIAAGDRVVPEAYRTPLPDGLGETAQGTLDAWRTIEWIRSLRPRKEEDGAEAAEKPLLSNPVAVASEARTCRCDQIVKPGQNWYSPGCRKRVQRQKGASDGQKSEVVQTTTSNGEEEGTFPGCKTRARRGLAEETSKKVKLIHDLREGDGTFFDPHVIAMLTGQSVADVLADWELLELYGFIDFVGGNRYVMGKDPITPQEMDARLSSMEDDLNANKPSKTRPQFSGKNNLVEPTNTRTLGDFGPPLHSY